MNKKLFIVVSIGLVGACASTYLFYQLMSKNFVSGRVAAREEMSVAVAARPLARGTRISEADVRTEGWTGLNFPTGAVSDLKAIQGRVVKGSIDQGQMVRESDLLSDDEQWLAAAIPPGMRGITVHVGEFAGVTQYLEIGDRVDVLVADQPRAPSRRDVKVETLLENIEVIATGREGATKGQRKAIPAVTLLVEAGDSEKVQLADQSGAIRLALRNPLDDGHPILGKESTVSRSSRPDSAGTGKPGGAGMASAAHDSQRPSGSEDSSEIASLQSKSR